MRKPAVPFLCVAMFALGGCSDDAEPASDSRPVDAHGIDAFVPQADARWPADAGPVDARHVDAIVVDALVTGDFEPNNTRGTAHLISPGTYDSLAIDPRLDEDWFRFDLDQQNDVVIEILFTQATGDLDLGLVDSSGTEIQYSTGSVDNERIERSTASGGPIGPGTFYIHVYSFMGQDTNTYTLVLTVN
jgi:hypothetical protein